MSILRSITGGLRSLFHGKRDNREMDREVSSFLEISAREKMKAGMSRADAMRAARMEIGSADMVKEESRAWGWESRLETVWQDLRYAARVLAKNPGFAAVAVLSLALGIGANTAIFTLIDSVLLKTLPLKNPHELVIFEWWIPPGAVEPRMWMSGNSWDEDGKSVGTPLPYPAFAAMRASQRGVADMFAISDMGRANLVADGTADLTRAEMATAGIFNTLGLHPAAGRFYDEQDDRAGASPVCVISYGYWKRRFGADPNISGKQITLSGVPFAIAGVMPGGFDGVQTGDHVDVWAPLALQSLIDPNMDPKVSMFAAADHWWLIVMGRLKPGVSRAQAETQLNAIFTPVATDGISARQAGDHYAIPALQLEGGAQGLGQLSRTYSRPLFVLLALVGLVLLIACANVANLLLARGTARQREIGVRLSLGASRWRLMRQLLTESLLLAGVGGALGYLLATWGSGVLVAMISPKTSPLALDMSLDARVLAFSIGICILTALLFGIAPAWRAARTDLTPALRQGSPGAAGLKLGWGKTLVAAQVALSLVLLFGAALFVRTLVNMRHIQAGFEADHVLLFGLHPSSDYKEPALKALYAEVQERLTTLPGVISATASWHLIVHDGARGERVTVPGYTVKSAEDRSSYIMPAGPNFFATMRIPILRGRDFNVRDTANSPKVYVINEAFARKYFGGRDPLGERMGMGGEHPEADGQVIGIVRDAKYASLRNDAPPTVYQPLQQAFDIPYMNYEVHTAGDPLEMVPTVRAAVASIDPKVPIYRIQTEENLVDEALTQERLFAKLTSFLGGLALVLACIGLYGTLAYAVARRTREIGIRMALGAKQFDVLGMVLRETLVLIAVGIAVGVPAALGATRLASGFIADFLYGLKPTDVASIVAAASLLAAVALCAGAIPARRAAKVDPLIALRYE
ncbi:MAG TPA: ABC transporter permease [Candidatus Acidoferrales bacterium]|nr:ABC transporter permease [Candidatus Acidoferrales bacterium]